MRFPAAILCVLLLLLLLLAVSKNAIILLLGESAVLLFLALPALLIVYVISAGIKLAKAGEAEKEKEKIGPGLDALSPVADNHEKVWRRNELILAVLVAAVGLFFFYKVLMFLAQQ